MAATPISVLCIDDDPNDSELLRAATQLAEVSFLLHCVDDGEVAMDYLQGRGCYADRTRFPLPALILLDWKMPRTTGLDLLKWIREHPKLQHVPVMVLSGSELKEDMRQAYADGASSYFVKPLGFDAMIQMVRNIHASWLAHRKAA